MVRVGWEGVCVLTCPLEGRAVSNTKAYRSPLDVPPPPRNLTTRIKAKLRTTHSSVVSYPPDSSPKGSVWQSHALMLGPRARAITRSLLNAIQNVQAHLLFPPPASQYCPTLPHSLPAFVEDRAGPTYTAIVCRRISMYSSMVRKPHSFNTSPDFGYTHSFPGPLRGLWFFAIR